MEPSQTTWLLLVNYNFQAIGRCFTVITTSVDSVETLKEKAKEEALVPSPAQVPTPVLAPCGGRWEHRSSTGQQSKTWNRYFGASTSVTRIPFRGFSNLSRWQISNFTKARRRDPACTNAWYITYIYFYHRLHVLIQAIHDASNEDRSVGQLVRSPVDPDHEDMILRAATKGIFTETDVHLNDIMALSPKVSELVLEFEKCLSLKRRTMDT